MSVTTYYNFTSAYIELCDLINEDYDFVSSPRGMKIKEKLGVQFRILDPRNRLPYVGERDFSLSYFVAESIWYMSGCNSTNWISYYAPFWKNISDDGVTANSAYGARIFKSHPWIADGGLNQWEYVKNELKRDPDSRRAVIHIRTPSDSLHAVKDVPCTLSLQFFVRDERLHLHVSMRSSDIILGIPYDVAAFTLMQEVMANELGLELGHYVHTSNSLHCYEKDFLTLEKIASSRQESDFLPMDPLPKSFPIDDLVKIENVIRNINESEFKDGLQFINSFENKHDAKTLTFLDDWSKILCSVKARKLKNESLSKTYIDSTSFDGFNFFKR